MNRRASIQDIFYVIVVILFFGITVFMGHIVLTKIQQTGSTITASAEGAHALSRGVTAVESWDSIFTFVVLISVLASIAAAWFIRSHPMFFVFAILMLVLMLVVAAAISGAWTRFTASNADVSSLTATFPKISFILDHLPLFGLLYFFLMAAALYMSPPQL